MTEDTPANENGVTNNANGTIEPTLPTMARPDYSNFLDDPMLAELGWPVGEDIFSSLWTDDTLGTVG